MDWQIAVVEQVLKEVVFHSIRNEVINRSIFGARVD
jgi:hypothetical protein